MKLDITGRNVNVTLALREFTEDKLRKLERLVDSPIEAHVVLRIDKHRQGAEIQIKSRNVIAAPATSSRGGVGNTVRDSRYLPVPSTTTTLHPVR